MLENVQLTSSATSHLYNRTLMGYLVEEEEALFNKTVRKIRQSYLMGDDPLNLSQINNTYFVQFPGCFRQDMDACMIITENYDSEILYDIGGYVLYKLDGS